MTSHRKLSHGRIKPPAGSSVDWGDPINNKLICKVIFAEGVTTNKAMNIANRKLLTPTGAPTRQKTPFGLSPNGFSNTDYYSTPCAIAQGSDVTVSWWQIVANNAGSNTSAWGSDGADRLQCHSPYSGTMYFDYPDSGTGRITCGLGAGYDNKWVHLAAIGGAKYRALYINGIKQAEDSVDVTSSFTSSHANMGIGKWLGFALSQAGAMDVFGVWTRQLKSPEIQRLYAEPFAGIQEPFNRRVTAAAAGGFRASSAYQNAQVIGAGVF